MEVAQRVAKEYSISALKSAAMILVAPVVEQSIAPSIPFMAIPLAVMNWQIGIMNELREFIAEDHLLSIAATLLLDIPSLLCDDSNDNEFMKWEDRTPQEKVYLTAVRMSRVLQSK